MAATKAHPFLEAFDLGHRYEDRMVLEGLSFAVERGERFGLLGPNGAGKTTAFALLCGLLAPSAGQLELEGRPVRLGDRRLRTRTGVVFQSTCLDQKLTARENLLLAAALYQIPRAQAAERAQALLALCDLSDRAEEAVSRYSGGMRRRLEIARALVHDPDLLIMDEPTAGLDEASFQRIWSRLKDLCATRGLTILLTTHRPEEAEHCGTLAILSGGRVIACESPDALRARVSGDIVILRASEPAEVARVVQAQFGLSARIDGDSIVIERERGHELIPRLVEAFPPGRFDSVSMRRPGLADAFLKLTGQALEQESRP